MEEKNKAKTVNMENNGKETKVKKLSYEQLNDACNQLWQQNKQLMQKNQELGQIAFNKRLDYLFKVLEFHSNFSSDFVVSCANEIEEAMTIPQEAEENKKNE